MICMAANPEELHSLVREICERQNRRPSSRRHSRTSSRSSSRTHSPVAPPRSSRRQSTASPATENLELSVFRIFTGLLTDQLLLNQAPPRPPPPTPYNLSRARSSASSAPKYTQYTAPSKASKLSPSLKKRNTSASVPDLSLTPSKVPNPALAAFQFELDILHQLFNECEKQRINDSRHLRSLSNRVTQLQEAEKRLKQQHKTTKCELWAGFVFLGLIVLAATATVVYFEIYKKQ